MDQCNDTDHDEATLEPPATLAEALTTALDDGDRIDRDLYSADFGYWHRPDTCDGVCHACLGGMAIAGTLGAARDVTTTPGDFACWRPALTALDNIRAGRFLHAYSLFHGHDAPVFFDDELARMETYYRHDASVLAEFTSWYEYDKLAVILRGVADEFQSLGI